MRILILLIFILGLVGCSSTTPTRQFALTFKPAPVINPTPQAQAAPLVVNIYQLKSLDNFVGNDFFSVYQNYKKTLGNSLLGFQQIVLFPGQENTTKLQLNAASQYLGIVAAFNNINASNQWLLTQELTKKKKQKLVINVEQNSISKGDE